MARLARTSQKAAKATWMNPPMRRTRLDHAATGPASFIAAGSAVTVINGVAMAFAASGLVVMACPVRVRYHATVAAMASASGVPAAPNVDWYLLVSRTKGSSNS